MDQFKQFLLEGRFPLVMSLPRNDPALAEAAWKNGADVVKVHVNVKHHASQTLFGTFEEERSAIEAMLSDAKGPMGIVLGAECAAAEQTLPLAVACGFDFLSLYGHHTAPRVLAADGVSKMIAPDYTWADWEIAAGCGGRYPGGVRHAPRQLWTTPVRPGVNPLPAPVPAEPVAHRNPHPACHPAR